MDNKSIKRKSQQGAFISALGFVLMLTGFIYGSIKLNQIKETLENKTVELTRIDSILAKKDNEMEYQDSIIKEKREFIDTLVQKINKLTDSKIEVKAKAEPLKNYLDNQNRPLFDFSIWINSSPGNMEKIDYVVYHFNHNSFLMNSRSSHDKSNGFLVGYRGWGCLEIVQLEVNYKNQKKETIFFNMCKAINQ